MKKILYVLATIVFFTEINSCKKNDDPLADYAEYGIFKEAYPLKDSVTIDLKQGDSTAIETNMGKMWVKISYLYVSCYKGTSNGSCPDGGLFLRFQLLLSGKNQELGYQFDAFPQDNSLIRYPLVKCNEIRRINGYGELKTIGNMNILYRNIYPNPATKTEYDKLIANNGFHTILTFQKVCR